MDATVQDLFSAGIAPSTHKTYRSGSKRFIQFCEQYGISEPFPVNEQVLVYFVASLYRGGLSGGTVKSYLAAVRHAQIALGLDDPHSAEMRAGEVVVPSASDYNPAIHLSHGDVRAENTASPQYLEI